MTEPVCERRPRILVPVLTLRNASGSIDLGANRAYAQRAAATWLDGFIVSGTIGEGDLLTPGERHNLLSVWLDELTSVRVLGCVWESADLTAVLDSGARPLVLMHRVGTRDEALRWLGELPSQAFVYSHPRYTTRTYDPDIATAARARGIAPAGGKICKVGLAELTALRGAAGPGFQLYDGRCRHLSRSVESGATGVIAVPLCTFPVLPQPDDMVGVQALIAAVQVVVDARSSRAARLVALKAELAQQ